MTVGNSVGRGFNGAKHGDGALTSGGDADVTTWPGTNGGGAGLRGGPWSNNAPDQRLSDRRLAAVWHTLRAASSGGRGVRSAP